VLGANSDIKVVAECADGRTAARLAREVEPDLVLMDIEMPEGDRISATAEIVRTTRGARVLILTIFDLDDYVLDALRAGASGFLLKTTPPRELAAAVKACAAGQTTLGPTVIERPVDSYKTLPSPVTNPG